MEFEWDERKNQANRAKHGISFEEAKYVFDGPTVSWIDNRWDYGEVREITIGVIQDEAVIVVVHTDRNERIRLISARTANRDEREIYNAHFR
jgi:uncharacterized DUF497 family protein